MAKIPNKKTRATLIKKWANSAVLAKKGESTLMYTFRADEVVLVWRWGGIP